MRRKPRKPRDFDVTIGPRADRWYSSFYATADGKDDFSLSVTGGGVVEAKRLHEWLERFIAWTESEKTP